MFEGLSQGDANILNGVVRVDLQVALRLDIQVKQAVPGNLIQHVLQKRNTKRQRRIAFPIQVQRHGYLCFFS